MTNLERMIALAEEFFGAKNDPEQLAVDEQVLQQLKALHPATLGELTEGDGPVAWMLVVPTTHLLMERFLMKEIGERALLRLTDPHGQFDALYLCSALVLPEYRGKGVAKNLAMRAIRAIQQDHPIEQLFYWAFSVEGEKLAAAVARDVGLPLFRRG
jgi:ribosomal protein S18 acetylase RimI-like enzyme